MKRLIIWLAFGLSATSPVFAQELSFSKAHTEACLQEAVGLSERYDCIGASAGQCMTETLGGETTVGMGGCLDRERAYWDARLNETYQRLLAQQADRETAITDNLRAMQRSWISYRDARCDYEFVQWGGGTGGGPAILDCLMRATAEQVFILEQYVR